MTSVPTARRGRPPRGAAQLSRRSIVDAALQLIDADGSDAVTMRSVARILGVDAKSLYNHVADKDGLLDAVAEGLLGLMRVPEPTGNTRADLAAIAHSFRAVALQHPRAAALVLTRQLTSYNGLAPAEAVLEVLVRAGTDPTRAVHIMRVLVATLIGTLLREVQASPIFGSTEPAITSERETTLTESGLPRMRESATTLARLDRDAEYEFTLNFMIDAVVGQLQPGTKPGSVTSSL